MVFWHYLRHSDTLKTDWKLCSFWYVCKAGWIGVGWSQETPTSFPGFLLLASLVFDNNGGEEDRVWDWGWKKPSNQHVSVVECIKSILSCSAIVEWDCLRSVRHKVLSTGHWEKIIVFFSFLISGCKKSWYCDIFSGWIGRSPYSAESIEERYETLLRSFSSF